MRTFIIQLCLIHFLFGQISSENDSFIIEYASKLITRAFRVKNCLYFIGDGSILSSVIHRSLMDTKRTIVILNYDLNDNSYVNCNCDGFVAVSDSYNWLLRLFEIKTNRKFQFVVHKRVLVFFGGRANFFVEPFSFLASRCAIDIQIIQGFQNYSSPLLRVNNSFQLHNLESNSIYKKRKLDLFNDNQALNWQPDFTVRPDLKFRASAFDCTPFVLVDSTKTVYDGVEHRILQEIARGWPFLYKIHDYDFQTDLFLNLTNEVLSGNSDVAMCSHWMTFSLQRNSDISYPYTQACATFLVPKPLLLPNASFVFQPVEISLWFVTLMAVLIAAVSLYASACCYVRYFDRAEKFKYENFLECVLDVLRLLVLNSLKRFPSPSQYTFRFIVTAWCIICLILSTCYSAGFSSLLTYPRHYRRINTLQDMIDNKIHWGEATKVTPQYLASSHQNKLIRLAKLFQYEGSFEDKLKRLKKQTHGTVVTKLPMRYLTGTSNLDDFAKTHLKVLSDCFGLYYFIFPLPKNSPYKKLFQEKIIRFTEHGLIARWYSDILTKYNNEYMQNFYTPFAEATSARVQFTVDKIEGALFLLATGLILSSAVFTVEVFSFKSIVQENQH